MPRTCATIVGLLFASIAAAGDWPQWLGPNRDGGSSEKIAAWKDPPRKVWSVEVGDGHSGPVISGGTVFLHQGVKDKDEEELVAFDAAKGTKLWSKTYPRAPFKNQFGYGPRATPVVADGKVYTFGVTGILSCFKADNGEQLWQVDTLAKFKAPNLTFGLSCSPLVDGDRVIVAVGKGASVVAFDRTKGEVVWESLKDPASYSSPVIYGKDKDRQLTILTQQGVVALKPEDGKLLWKFPLVDLLSESSTTPIRAGGVLFASSVTFGSVGLKVDEKDGKLAANQEWKNPALTCYFSTPVAVGKDHIYLVTGALISPQATLRCVEAATGKELWKKGPVGKYHATLLRTGDDKLLMLEEAGSLVLVEPNAREYRELARSKVCGHTWAHPALANGKLYIRDEKELICLQVGE
jgi:outer membrane protein assembly factor BamB